MAETLHPVVNDLNRPFWDGAARGKLVLPHCANTGRAFWPPGPISPFADGGPVVWRTTSAGGRIDTIVIYRRVFQKALADIMPYGVAQVRLDAGPSLLAHVRDADGIVPGDRVALRFEPLIPGGPAVPIVIPSA
jgi:uncharacterized OB-fold protein